MKNYTQAVGAGVKTDLAAADLGAPAIDFFWIDGGSQIVTVTAQVAGVALTATVTFTIKRLTVDHFTAIASTVNVCVGTYFQPGTWLAAYQPAAGAVAAKNGCQWDAKVTAPDIGVGQVGFTQRIQPSRVNTNNAGIARTKASASFVLDEGLGIQYSGPQAVANSASVTLNGNSYADSPASGLTATNQTVSATDNFELYLMYKSSEVDSIWVTLSNLTWQWAGQSTRIGAPAGVGNTWNPPTGTSLSATGSSNSTTLPEWSTNFGAIPWV